MKSTCQRCNFHICHRCIVQDKYTNSRYWVIPNKFHHSGKGFYHKDLQFTIEHDSWFSIKGEYFVIVLVMKKCYPLVTFAGCRVPIVSIIRPFDVINAPRTISKRIITKDTFIVQPLITSSPQLSTSMLHL